MLRGDVTDLRCYLSTRSVPFAAVDVAVPVTHRLPHMLRLHLVRHAQTACSAAGVFCGGACDVPLNPTGHAMAASLAEHLAATPWQALYTSPQQRAQQTL